MTTKKTFRTLVLVTYQYPFLPGEYFIETEVVHLAEAYERVIIFPMRRVWSRQSMAKRSLPDNVHLIDPRSNIFLYCLSFFKALLLAPLLVLEFRSRWSGAATIQDCSLGKWLASAIKVLLAKAALQKYFGKDTGEIIFYSYWRLEAAAALSLLKYRGIFKSVFSRVHRGDLYFERRYPFESLIQDQCQAVFSVSVDGVSFLSKQKNFSGKNIYVQRLGIHLPSQHSPMSSDAVIRIATCSNIISVKRVDHIARCIDALPYDVEWVHFGDGVQRPELERIISGFQNNHRVILKGRVPNHEVQMYYQNNPVDLFINLSESEGVPVSIMEALAHGIPVLATNVGGTGEIVDDSCGYLLDVNASFDDFFSGVRYLLQPERRIQLRAAARQRAEERCDAAKNYPQNYALINRLCADDQALDASGR